MPPGRAVVAPRRASSCRSSSVAVLIRCLVRVSVARCILRMAPAAPAGRSPVPTKATSPRFRTPGTDPDRHVPGQPPSSTASASSPTPLEARGHQRPVVGPARPAIDPNRRLLGGGIGEVLGYGGMAEVSGDVTSGCPATSPSRLLRADLARDPSFQMRFRREAQAAALLDYPAIVAVYETGKGPASPTSSWSTSRTSGTPPRNCRGSVSWSRPTGSATRRLAAASTRDRW